MPETLLSTTDVKDASSSPRVEFKDSLTADRINFLIHLTKQPDFTEYKQFWLAEIRYGSKILNLTLHKDGHFGSIVETDSHATKLTNETTICYQELTKLLKKIATELGQPVQYSLNTFNEKMRLWAKGKGRDVFDWQNISEDDDILTASTVILP